MTESMLTVPVEHWPEERRRTDGCTVKETVEGFWIVVPPDDRAAISVCPCCDRQLKTAFAAKVVCNTIYPLAS